MADFETLESLTQFDNIKVSENTTYPVSNWSLNFDRNNHVNVSSMFPMLTAKGLNRTLVRDTRVNIFYRRIYVYYLVRFIQSIVGKENTLASMY